MARSVTDVSELQSYIRGVIERAEHHAGNVDEVALELAGAILWRKDDDEPISVMTYRGETANVLWVRIGGTRYAFSYNHQAGAIEMRQDSTQGNALHRFTNAMTLAEVKRVFDAL